MFIKKNPKYNFSLSLTEKSLHIVDLSGELPKDEHPDADHSQVPNDHPDKHSPHGRFESNISDPKFFLNDSFNCRKGSHHADGHRHSIMSNDMALTDTVSNVVDFVKERHARHRYRHNMHTKYRGSWSASSSPAHSPIPNRYGRESNAHMHDRYLQSYGTTSLQQRSRSPSPSQANTKQFRGLFLIFIIFLNPSGT